MNTSVKKFIQENKKAIEDDMWTVFFFKLIRDPWVTPSDVIDVLSKAGITFSGKIADIVDGYIAEEDLGQFLNFLAHVRTNTRSPVSGEFLSAFDHPENRDFEWEKRLLALARAMGFDTYETDCGAYEDLDYAIIAPQYTIDHFVRELSYEDSSVTRDMFTKINGREGLL